MKTQLLEDIGENTTLFPAPSKLYGRPEAGKEVQKPASAGRTEPAGKAEPAKLRSTPGVWRQAPVVEPEIPTAPQPDQQPAAPDLDELLEELAALEAQYVPPVRQPEPAVAPAAPPHEPPAPAAELLQERPPPPAEPMREPPAPAAGILREPHAPPAGLLRETAIPPAGPTLRPEPVDTATAPQDPLFDFTLPSPELQAANPFTRPAPRRSRRRYFLWAACLLLGALLILGGRWLYQERKDAGSLAPIANDAKDTPQVAKAVQRPALAAQETTAAPAADTRMQSTEPAEPASRPAPSVPPLVYLEPGPSPAAKTEQPASSAAGQTEARTASGPAAAAEQGRVYPLPKRTGQTARERSEAAARRARAKVERAPARQLARAPVVATERRPELDTSMEATLKACREHGYHAAQCIKRDCSVTEYGFVCRGR
jgi:hypothetical protein